MPLTQIKGDEWNKPTTATTVSNMFREVYQRITKTEAAQNSRFAIINAKYPPKGFKAMVGNLGDDDAPALQAMIDALDVGGTIFLPAGTYRLLSPIVLPYQTTNTVVGLNIIGCGPKSTILYADNTTGGIIAKGTSTATCNFMFRDLSICCLHPTTNTDAIGVDMEYSNDYNLFDNVRLEAFATAIRMANTRNTKILNCVIYGSTVAGVKIMSTANSAMITNSSIRSNYDNINIEGGTGHAILGCDISMATHCNLYATNAIGLTINAKADANNVTLASVYLDTCQNVSIINLTMAYLALNAVAVHLYACRQVSISQMRTYESSTGGYLSGTTGLIIDTCFCVTVEASRFIRMETGIYINQLYGGRISAVEFAGCYQNFNVRNTA